MKRLAAFLLALSLAPLAWATTYDVPSVTNACRIVYEGYVLDAETNLLGTVRVVAAKPDKNNARSIAASAKILGLGAVTFRTTKYTQCTNIVLTTRDDAHTLALTLSSREFWGTFDSDSPVTGVMDFFAATDTESKRRIKAWRDWRPTCAVRLGTPPEAAFPGWSVFSVRVGPSAQVVTSCVMADGTRLSSASRAMIFNQGARIEIPVRAQMYPKSLGGCGFIISLTNDVLSARNISAWDATTRRKSPVVTNFTTNEVFESIAQLKEAK